MEGARALRDPSCGTDTAPLFHGQPRGPSRRGQDYEQMTDGLDCEGSGARHHHVSDEEGDGDMFCCPNRLT